MELFVKLCLGVAKALNTSTEAHSSSANIGKRCLGVAKALNTSTVWRRCRQRGYTIDQGTPERGYIPDRTRLAEIGGWPVGSEGESFRLLPAETGAQRNGCIHIVAFATISAG